MNYTKFLGLIALGMITMAGTASAQIPGTFVGATAGPTGNTTLVGGGEFSTASGSELNMWLDGSNTTGDGSRSLRTTGGLSEIADSGGFKPQVQPGPNVKDAPIVTVISGLTPGTEYEINVIYSAQWGHTDIAIGAGLTPETAATQVPDVGSATKPFGSWLDEVSEQNNFAGGTVGTNSAARVWYSLLGTATADSEGEIPVYLDHVVPAQFLSAVTAYNGVSYSEVVSPVLLGDVDLSGEVNFLDISPFIAHLSNGTDQDEADCNEDGTVSFLDIAPFIGILSGG